MCIYLIFVNFFIHLIFLYDVADEESFDEIRFAAYRTAAKLLFVQSKTNCKYGIDN